MHCSLPAGVVEAVVGFVASGTELVRVFASLGQRRRHPETPISGGSSRNARCARARQEASASHRVTEAAASPARLSSRPLMSCASRVPLGAKEPRHHGSRAGQNRYDPHDHRKPDRQDHAERSRQLARKTRRRRVPLQRRPARRTEAERLHDLGRPRRH